MKRSIVAMLVVVALAVLGASSCSALTATPKSDGRYDFDWTGSTVEQVMADLYNQYSVQSITMVRDYHLTQTKATNLAPKDLPQSMAWMCDVQWWSVRPGVSLFCAHSAQASNLVEGLFTMKLVASLTDEQLDLHESNGGIPIKSLTQEQLPMGRYIAQLWCRTRGNYLQPERIDNSKIVLSIEPEIRSDYERQTVGNATFNRSLQMTCHNLDKSLLDFGKWAYTVDGFAKLYKQDSANANGPGGFTTNTYSGIYTLRDLLKKVGDGSKITVSSDIKADQTRIAVYGDFTGAELAQSCAVTTGMEWNWDNGVWMLVRSELSGYIDSVTPSKYAEIKSTIESLKDKAGKVARSGKLRFMIDPVWSDVPVQDVANGKTVDWGSLTPAQQAALTKAATDAPGSKELADTLPTLPLKWQGTFTFHVFGPGNLYGGCVSYK